MVKYQSEDAPYIPEVTCDCNGSPFPRLVLQEVRRLQRQAHLTTLQANVFEWYVVRGLTFEQIATALCISKPVAWRHFCASVKKVEKIPYLGLLSTIIELFGWQDVRQMLAERGEHG
jgi:predicted DNA-binding protein YlxM (UPF0122 family)